MSISSRSRNKSRHSSSWSLVYSVRDISMATGVSSLKFGSETAPAPAALPAECATHCYIVHYAAANTSTLRGTGLADWVRMARRFVSERGDEVRERLAFGILILLLIFLFAFTFAVLGKGEYEPAGGEAPRRVPSALA